MPFKRLKPFVEYAVVQGDPPHIVEDGDEVLIFPDKHEAKRRMEQHKGSFTPAENRRMGRRRIARLFTREG